MIKQRFFLLLLPLLFLSACAPKETNTQDKALSLVASTYPIYLFLSELTHDVPGLVVTPLINQNVSCLHDYTLTVSDMKTLEGADALFVNGAGLDAFALTAVHPSAQILDCSVGLDPIHLSGEEAGHDHSSGTDIDPHYWLDPERAAQMLLHMSTGLEALDPANATLYHERSTTAAATLRREGARMREELADLQMRSIISFHDGFSYFAQAFDLEILISVEEEEGQTASAQLIASILSLLEEKQIPAIFTEEYSADMTAKAIAREADIEIYPLSLLMSGETDNAGIDRYLADLQANVDTILEALS